LSNERVLLVDDDHKALDRQGLERDSARLKALFTLFNLSQSFMLPGDPDASLRNIVSAGVDQTGSDWGVVLLKDEGKPQFEARTAVGCNAAPLVPGEYALSSQTAAQAAAAGRLLVWKPGEQPEPFFASPRVNEKAVAALATPLIARGRVVGILALAKGPGRSGFTEVELEFVSLLATMAATALDNICYSEHTRREYDKLCALNYLEDEFLALAAHELRTPLAVMSSYAQLLEQEVGPPQKPLLEALARGVDRLDSLTRILAQPKLLKTGVPGPQAQRFALLQLLTEVVNEFAALTHDKGQSVEISCSEEATSIVADRARIRIVLESLLDNAVRFTPVGGYITLQAESSDNGVCLTVSDSGPGIPDDEQQWVFKPFRHLESASMGGQSGLGLGLALSKRIVEAQGGRLWLQSVVGHGSSFHFTIPNCVPLAAAADAECTSSADGDVARIPSE
jgi:signal transduction histidine kinase